MRASEWLLADVKTTIQNVRQQLAHLMKLNIDHLQERLTTLQKSYIFQEPTRILQQPTERLDDLKQQLMVSARQRQHESQQQLRLLTTQLHSFSPTDRLKRDRERLQGLQRLLQTVGSRQIHRSQLELAGLINQLVTLDPEKVLARGYSYVTKKNQVIKQVQQVTVADRITIHLVDGDVEAEIKQIKHKGAAQHGNN